jgi:hypothetical protein
MKHCPECQQKKPIDQFHKSASHPSGYAPRCIPCAKEVAAKWYVQNKDKKRAYDAKRRQEKRELYRAASKRFRDNQPGKKNADTQFRRAELRKRVPKWANRGDCVALYESAARVSQCLGSPHVVDHVIPLRGKSVSGLHVPGNLRVIPQRMNLLKSNRF